MPGLLTTGSRLNDVLSSCTEHLYRVEARLDILDGTFSAKCQAVESPSAIRRLIRAPTREAADKLTLPTCEDGNSSQVTTSTPFLNEDIMIMIIDLIGSTQMSCSFPSVTTGAMADLKSLRLVSRLFSRITARALFKISVVGLHPLSRTLIEIPPPVVQTCTKYLSLQPYAFSIDRNPWLDLLTSIEGLHCEGGVTAPFWNRLAGILCGVSIKPNHLSVRLSTTTLELPQLGHFEECMKHLSTRLESISVDMKGCGDSYGKELEIIRLHLPRLTSIQFLHLDHTHSMDAFATTGWACRNKIRSLHVSRSSLVFRLLSKFVAYAPHLEDLIVEDCSGWDAAEGVVFLELPGSHALKRVKIPQYCGKGVGQASVAVIGPTNRTTTWEVV